MRFLKFMAFALVFGCAATPTKVKWSAPLHEEDYPLDEDVRRLARGEDAYCPVVQVLEYSGSYVPYDKPLRINPFFRERLIAFEHVVHEVAVRTVGAPPTAILHFGTYNCRTISGKARLSEHAFANAIDVSGFQFGDVRVSVLRDWWKDTRHARFMHELALELAARPDIFRGVLGPGYPGHDDHLHLDMGPRHYINVDVPSR